jgi:hypothetical protein
MAGVSWITFLQSCVVLMARQFQFFKQILSHYDFNNKRTDKYPA